MEVNRRRLIVNALSNYGYLVAILIGGLFLQAFIVRNVGRYEYALWPLIATCFAVLELLPIGIGQGAGQFRLGVLAAAFE